MSKLRSFKGLFTCCADLIRDGDRDTDVAAIITMVCSAGLDQAATLSFVEGVLQFQRLAVMSAADMVTDSEALIASLAMQGIYRDSEVLS